ncbi:adhesion G-protein coupled receptor G2-like isoform X2 [Colossoma macropomum]|nr:adhesion G-protein coupled receptor G2-like isoform X2 [Colossoma macropomum]
MTVVRMDKSTVNDDFVKISTPQVSDRLLSVTTMIPVERFQNVSEEKSKVAVVMYSSAKQFMISQRNITILSPVIRIEVVDQIIKDLAKSLSINFTLNNNSAVPANYCLSCQYYDEDNHEWIGRKCLSPRDYYNDSNIANCSYDHMTPFAVLMVDVQIDKTHWQILSYISYIGCGISALFSLAAILIFFVKRTPTADSSNSIHVSLSAALLLLNTSFLFSEWAASWSIEGVCVFVAVMIEYSLLCCFSWMAIEALHVYLLLIKVFNTYIRHYMVKLSLFGWGVPALFVGASLSVYKVKAFYGSKKVTLTDTTDKTTICWVTDVFFLYGMNIAYYSIVFLSNTAVLSTVASQICKLRRLGSKGKKLPTCKDISTVLGLTCLLGLTWGLAFVTSGYTNYPVLYLFCICNTLQGLFMFLWVYGTMRKNRRVAAETLSPTEPYSSTGKPNTSSSHDFSHYS